MTSRTSRGSIAAALALGAALTACWVMLRLSPPTGLAAPSGYFQVELALGFVGFLIFLLLLEPLRTHGRDPNSNVGRFLRRTVTLSARLRVVVLLSVCISVFVFAFWSTVDVLGGYNGDRWSLAQHPILRMVYDLSGIRYLGPWDVGSESVVFFAVAFMGVTLLLAKGGLGAALKDALTLFVAPSLIVFELSLWYSAPSDMSWHVIDALWLGGANDLGWRALDGQGGSAFVFSNWLILLVSLMMLATRLPFLEAPSRLMAQGLSTVRLKISGMDATVPNQRRRPVLIKDDHPHPE